MRREGERHCGCGVDPDHGSALCLVDTGAFVRGSGSAENTGACRPRPAGLGFLWRQRSTVGRRGDAEAQRDPLTLVRSRALASTFLSVAAAESMAA